MKLELSPVIRYWEYNSKEIFSLLQALKASGAESVSAWVPWSHLESDRHHSLQKFVKQAVSVGLRIKLGITPELSIGYPNGGIPDELLRDRQNLAQDRLGQNIYGCAPPNIHLLVSLMAPPVFQRYGHFLLKFTQELCEVIAEGFSGEIELVVTDSLFKHYRNTGLAAEDHGDYSMRQMQGAVGYTKEEWTHALSEKVYQSRALDFLRSRFSRYKNIKIVSHSVFARDASLARLLEEISGAPLNLNTYFTKLTRTRSLASLAWLDDLHTLSDRERNFLISSALVIYGEVWLLSETYLGFSTGFRKKMQKLISGFSTPETEFVRPAIALTQNHFAPARITQILQAKLGAALKMKSSLSEIQEKEWQQTKLLAVEEGLALEHKLISKLIQVAKKYDCTVVIFRSAICELGQKELERLESFRLNHGWQFEVTMFDSGGHLLVIEGQENNKLSMDTLGDSLLAVAKLSPICHFDRSHRSLFSISVDWRLEAEESSDEMRTLFLMNPSTEPEQIELAFTRPARIHGLGAGAEAHGEAVGKNFETTLPALSVIPLTVILEPLQVDLYRKDSHAGTAAELA